MIRDISSMVGTDNNDIIKFVKDCTIEEKIDAHYVCVEILSKNQIIIKKASGVEITRVDMILNSMWKLLFVDWNFLLLSNTEWFTHHVGAKISMFYFPVSTPISTRYKDNMRYLIDRVIINDNVISDNCTLTQMFSTLNIPNTYSIMYKHTLKKTSDIDRLINEYNDNGNIRNLFIDLIDKDNIIFAADECEGYIYRNGKNVYQCLLKEPAKSVKSERSQYEFLLCDFIGYCKATNYTEKITSAYIKTIYRLFNDYIINWESKKHTLSKNIDAASIESPNAGYRFEMGFEYISDPITKSLCESNILYANVFKVLLANLRRGKDNSHCVFMNKKQVDDWNTIMKNIKIRTVSI